MVPDTTVVCIDSLLEHTIALPNITIIDPLEATPFPKTGSQKINFKGAIGCQGKLTCQASAAL